MEAPELLTIAQAAAEFRVHPVTLYRWIADGRLTPHRRAAGRVRVFVDRRQVRKLLEPQPAKRKENRGDRRGG